MDNYDRSRESARRLFLNWDQEKMIARCGLRADPEALRLNFLGQPFRILRATGEVENLARGRAANFSETLSVYDYLCRTEPFPPLAGVLCAANALPNAAQSSPDTVALHRPRADRLQAHVSALGAALTQIGLAPFPQGDAACVFPVFDRLTAVFQFWEGDEEFPPSARFLWDRSTPGYLKYETLYYVMACFFDRLDACISEIEKNR